MVGGWIGMAVWSPDYLTPPLLEARDREPGLTESSLTAAWHQSSLSYTLMPVLFPYLLLSARLSQATRLSQAAGEMLRLQRNRRKPRRNGTRLPSQCSHSDPARMNGWEGESEDHRHEQWARRGQAAELGTQPHTQEQGPDGQRRSQTQAPSRHVTVDWAPLFISCERLSLWAWAPGLLYK